MGDDMSGKPINKGDTAIVGEHKLSAVKSEIRNDEIVWKCRICSKRGKTKHRFMNVECS